MKFFWKIFLSIMFVSAFFFSITSYCIIYLGFQSSLEREISASYHDNDILYYSLNREISLIEKSLDWESILINTKETGIQKSRWIRDTVQSITVSTSKGIIPFRICDINYKNIYESDWTDIGKELLKQLPAGKRGYEIIRYDQNFYVHTATTLTAFNETFYIESYHDISYIFENRDKQYKAGFYLIFAMLLVSGIVVLVITSWLIKPIRQLSRATKQIADGDFTRRVLVNSEDEIGKFSADFNIMAEHLEKTIGELKDANRRQESFVDSFAHELKTPLTSMIGYADMLRSKKLDTEQVVLSANYIYEEGKRLESLSMKLMEMIVLKKQNFTLKRVFASSFFENIQGTMRPVFEKENIVFTVSFEEAIIQIEHDLMKTVCMNLLDNARKAIVKDGKIFFSGHVTSDGYSIIVKDNGNGMEQSELSKITESFYMIDKSRARLQGGAGLGLSICAEIIKIHGGTMDFKSKPNQGTCVMIHLKGVNMV